METGYARVVANFETITIVLNGLGESYDPSQELIKLPGLRAKLEEAKAMMVAVDNAQAAYAVAVDEGERVFKDISTYAVNIKRSAAVELDDPAFTAGLQMLVKRISSRSRVAGVPSGVPEAGETIAKQRSAPNSGRDSQVALLADIIAMLRTREDYSPNDPSVTIEAIEQRISVLSAANLRIREAAANRSALIERRDAILFDQSSGIFKRAKLIKLHLARANGINSAAYRSVVRLRMK